MVGYKKKLGEEHLQHCPDQMNPSSVLLNWSQSGFAEASTAIEGHGSLCTKPFWTCLGKGMEGQGSMDVRCSR
eukprot:1145650-Pelagomonas_calceolata.AAC.3